MNLQPKKKKAVAVLYRDHLQIFQKYLKRPSLNATIATLNKEVISI